MQTVTLSNFRKNIEPVLEMAECEPVMITRRGKAYLVLLSHAEYVRLVERAERLAADQPSAR